MILAFVKRLRILREKMKEGYEQEDNAIENCKLRASHLQDTEEYKRAYLPRILVDFMLR